MAVLRVEIEYRKIGILSTGAYFKISSQNGCLFSGGVYFQGVLINACNFLVACSCVGTIIFLA